MAYHQLRIAKIVQETPDARSFVLEVPADIADKLPLGERIDPWQFGLDGVERAVVSFRDGHVTARIDPAKTNREAIVTALRNAQVDVTQP